MYLVTAARLVIAPNWKNNLPLLLEEWMLNLQEMREMDRLTRLLNNRSEDDWQKEWQPILKRWDKKI